MTSNASPSHPRRGSVVWSSIPVVTLGLLVATFAVLRVPWPPDPALPMGGQTVSHVNRTSGKQPGVSGVVPTDGSEKTRAWYARRVMDGAVYGLLLGGYAGVVLAVVNDGRYASVLLTFIGGIGMLYGALLGLYPGPILAMSGFSLVLFGAGLSWASRYSKIAKPYHMALETGVQTGAGFENHETHTAARS